MLSSLVLVSLLSVQTLAFNYVIGVGRDEVSGLPGIGFDPTRTVSNRSALPGQDTLVFSFLQGSHQVIQSSFNSPCTPLAGGFQTILQTEPNGTLQGAGSIYSFPIQNGSEPLWFYDAAGTNCQTGAVLCVNTNETSGSTETCTAFRAAAIAQGGGSYAAYTLTAHSGYTQTATSTSSSTSTGTAGTQTGTNAPSASTASASIPTFTKAASSPAHRSIVGGSIVLALVAGLVTTLFSPFLSL